MRKLPVVLAVTVAAAVAAAAAPTPALARTAANVREPAGVAYGVALPIYQVSSATWVPPGFSSDGAQAIRAAESNREMLAIHARRHPLHVLPRVWAGVEWLVDFDYRGKLIAEAVVSRAGRVTGVWTGPLARTVYVRGGFAVAFGHWWVLVPFSLLFLLPLLDPRRPLRMLHLDALVLLSFLVSYLLFDHAKLVPGVWAVYPPLLYLLARMLWLGGLRPRARARRTWQRARRPRAAARGPAPLLSTQALALGLGALVLARVALGLLHATVADVGYASVIGAHQLAGGHPLYFSSAAHGDTYGPVMYMAYLPFELLWPWHGRWDYLPAAHAASLCFDLVTVIGLVLLGRRLRAGRQGLRLGLALGWLWAACPFTLLALMMHTNDGLIAMLSVLSLLAFSSPFMRGALVGLAAAAKFVPGALLGLYASGRHALGARRGVKGMIETVSAFAAVTALSIGPFLPSGGLGEFYDQTIGFQLSRADVFSPWALYPSLGALKVALEVGAVLLCAIVAFVPRRRSLGQVAALAGAITIAVQLPAIHWFYYYIVWFVPFVFVALLAPRQPAVREPVAERQPGEPAGRAEPDGRPDSTPELVAV